MGFNSGFKGLIELSWRWAQSCSKHVEDSNKYIIEEIVRQVGHLPELYEDARSEKYKILLLLSCNFRNWNATSPSQTDFGSRGRKFEMSISKFDGHIDCAWGHFMVLLL